MSDLVTPESSAVQQELAVASDEQEREARHKRLEKARERRRKRLERLEQAQEERPQRPQETQAEDRGPRERDLASIIEAAGETDLTVGGGYFRLPERVRRLFHVPT